MTEKQAQDIMTAFADMKMSEQRKYASSWGFATANTYKGANKKGKLKNDFFTFLGAQVAKSMWDDRLKNMSPEEHDRLFKIEADNRPILEQSKELETPATREWREDMAKQAKQRDVYLADYSIWIPVFYNTALAQRFKPIDHDALCNQLQLSEDQIKACQNDHNSLDETDCKQLMNTLRGFLEDVCPSKFYFGLDTRGRSQDYGYWLREELKTEPTDTEVQLMSEIDISKIAKLTTVIDVEQTNSTNQNGEQNQ